MNKVVTYMLLVLTHAALFIAVTHIEEIIPDNVIIDREGIALTNVNDSILAKYSWDNIYQVEISAEEQKDEDDYNLKTDIHITYIELTSNKNGSLYFQKKHDHITIEDVMLNVDLIKSIINKFANRDATVPFVDIIKVKTAKMFGTI